MSNNFQEYWEDYDLELQIQNPHIHACKVCDPKLICQLAKGFCPYRDIDTLDHSIGKSLTPPPK